MNIRKLKSAAAIIVVLCLLAGCKSAKSDISPDTSDEVTQDSIQLSGDNENDGEYDEKQEDKPSEEALTGRYERPSLIVKELKKDDEVKANVSALDIEPDMSNVYRIDDYYLPDEARDKLYNNGFVVLQYGGDEFFDVYEGNRYDMKPSFITVDSLMHTYHLYFSYLMKNIEKSELSDNVLKLSEKMAENSVNQYEALTDSEWENAAYRNMVFFAVGARLLDEDTDVIKYADVAEAVNEETDRIYAADGIYRTSLLNEKEEDYTQYKPRGYYDGDEKLEKYFRAMMWYGRIHFRQDDEDLDRSALLITKALMEDEEAYELWSGIYAVTAFFAGASDDAGAAEYANVIEEAYGKNLSYDDLMKNKDAFNQFHKLTEALKVPQINSIPIWDGKDNIIPGFRFMGQRFTIDASVMQRLVYSAVKEDKNNNKRMLPDVLDFPAALGSETALEILGDMGETGYSGYMENMNKLKAELADDDSPIWSSSLYSGWLYTLRPLLNEDREGYPEFMQNKEWAKKNLESFAGSYTELKHDTVLYSKQVLAEMGGGYDEEYDDRGYVEPEPIVYSRFINLANQTKDGLRHFNMLSNDAESDLDKLITIAETLKTISVKELNNETPTDDEFDFIREYGGYIEHFWYEVARDATGAEYVSSQEFPSALVTDIATDPNGTVLELATGSTSQIDVLVKVDDKIKIAQGAVYSFYQFPWDMNDRLTDKQWWMILGIDFDPDNWESREEYMKNLPEKPEWTNSYRYTYDYDY